jgi:apurinic endonuclease APN1
MLPSMIAGAHISSAGGMQNVPGRAEAIASDAVQVFVQSARTWKPTNHRPEDLAVLREARERGDVQYIVCHAIYFINLATDDPALLEKSRTALANTIDVANAIGADGIVLHVGSHKGRGLDATLPQIARELKAALKRLRAPCWLLLENSAGAGGTIGRDPVELARIITAVDHPRLGLCIDTCHAFVSGVDVTADRAVWVINASEQAPDLASAVSGVQRSIDAVTGYLTAGGVPAEAITLEALGTSINYVWLDGTQTSDIASYSAYRSLRVRLDDVQLIDRLSRDFGDLLATGIAVNAWAPEYYVTTLPDLRPALLEQAVADALVRAEAMVGVVGGTVGDVRAIRSRPFQVSTRDSVDVSDYGMYDTTTIEKTVTATVSVTFAVD